jgi:dTDP-glucose 4,6-dehydratase
VLVTGGAGFIGSNLVRLLLAETDHQVTVLDALTYAGHRLNLRGLPRPVRFVRGDVANRADVRRALAGADAVVHLAAESHVDRSIRDPTPFVRTNVLGTQVLLDEARARGVRRFVHVSTDEVYGALGPTGMFSEHSPLRPSSPYAASKAGADLLVLACHRTHGLPAVVTRCTNNFGPYQFPEKLIPLAILRARERRPVPVYGNGLQVRDWIHVEDHCRALLRVLEAGRPGEVYNVGANQERTNREVVLAILDLVGAPRDLLTSVPDRPGHDFRYALDASKLRRELGWTPRWSFDRGLEATVSWYLEHAEWCRAVMRPPAARRARQPRSSSHSSRPK